MQLFSQLNHTIQQAVSELFSLELAESHIQITPTKPDFEGNFTLVVFALMKTIKGNPVEIGNKLGAYLQEHSPLVTSYNVVKGFLNLTIAHQYWVDFIAELPSQFWTLPQKEETVLVEYCGPNTNKPLHLGHVRTMLLGWSMAEIFDKAGYQTHKVNIYNDRGIAISKSMVAWERFANGATPESTNTKGDHFVGKYYVEFAKELQSEINLILNEIYQNNFQRFTSDETKELKKLIVSEKMFIKQLELQIKELSLDGLENFEIEITIEGAIDGNYLWKDVVRKYIDRVKGEVQNNVDLSLLKGRIKEIVHAENNLRAQQKIIKECIRKKTSILLEAQSSLQKWEDGDETVLALWKEMNSWVYAGFNETFQKIGVDFEKDYLESDTYLLGKEIVQKALEDGIFYQKDDNSIWVDLEDVGLDHKLLLRGDGTSVYMTQDLGTAALRYDDYKMDKSVYVVGNEQEYHFKVLREILKKLNQPFADGIYHLSYGMIELPNGKMKSREGTVVDADGLVDEMIATAKEKTDELGKIDHLNQDEKEDLYKAIGLGALKFFILRVDPKKGMLFDPNESIDFQGFTGPFVQYTHARIQSLLDKADFDASKTQSFDIDLQPEEIEIIIAIHNYRETLEGAAKQYDVSAIAKYAFDLAKTFNKFYANVSVNNEEDEEKRQFRLQLCKTTGDTIREALGLLGIQAPNRM